MSAETDAGSNYRGVWDNRIGFGKKPALLVIDFVKAYTTEGSPLYAQGVPPAVEQTQSVLAAARSAGIPVIYTTVVYDTKFSNAGAWIRKSPVLKCLSDPELGQFCDEIEPLEDELVVTKQYASAFFGTSLAATLTAAGIDTIILTGCSTSGCIRATAVDGVQHGFHVIVPQECVGDRHPDPHNANLFDINGKYGDVVDKSEVLDYFAGYSQQ